MILRTSGATAAIAAVVFVSACSFSPVSHRIKIGEEAFVVFAGEGADHNTDLFAVPADGGTAAQITFTPLIEQGPHLSRTGEMVAFLRMRDTLPATHRDVVVMNLSSGGEVTLAMPANAGRPTAVAWSGDGVALYVRTDLGAWRAMAPPAEPRIAPVAPADSAAVDSAFDILLGTPPFARVVACATGGLCVIGPRHDTTSLAPAGHDPIRWGGDSVAWFEQGQIVVRSLGPGRERRLAWTNAPANPRAASYVPGPVTP